MNLLSILLLLFLATSCSSPTFVEVQPMLQTATCAEEQIDIPESPCKPVQRKLIILDPGHGGKDLGAQSSKPPKYQEKFLNLSTAKIVKTYLEYLGYAVILTREEDEFVELKERAHFANNFRPDLFVSIHYNSAPNKSAEGIEIFYYREEENKSRTDSSKALAQAILQRMLVQTDAKSRGVKHGDLAVIRETDMPAVLVEGGFLTHASECQKIKTASYLKKLSWGIAQGIDDYLKTNDKVVKLTTSSRSSGG